MTGELGEGDLARIARAGIGALSAEQGLELFDAARALEQALRRSRLRLERGGAARAGERR